MRTVYFACLFCLLSCLFNLIHGKGLFRLPRDVFPTAYEIQLHPDFNTDNFTGEVRIVLTNVVHVNMITLHSANLTIEDVKFDNNGDITYNLDPENELLHISYYSGKDSIPAGEHVLNIKFSGVYNAPLGVYKYSKNNNTFIATKFSTIFARRAFPCFDEPSFKATFNLRVLRPNDNYRTLSNMKLIRSYNIPSGILDEFQTTPIMSTYLLAFVITDLEYSETTFKQGSQIIPIRVFANGTEKDRQFAMNIAKKVMKYFRDYTDIDYPLPKVDLIELPHYASRGMEHWGLVCFSKGSLVQLKNMKLIRLNFELGSALLIAHELSHFYFGDLVTHSWYSDLWLTEGFGRYMQYKALNSIYPDMDMDDLQNQLYYLYYIDDLSTTLPIVSQVMKINEIKAKYSGVVYPKGARILRMINYVIGEEKFKKAIRNYLRNNEYSAVSTGQFIKELQEVEPDVNMNGFVDVWLHENKYPIVTIREDLNSSSYIVEQNCVPETKNSSVTICQQKWTIPIFYVTSENKMTPKMVWFDRDMDFVTIPKGNEKWLKLNHKEIAFYRTNYDDGLWQNLIENFKELSSMDKGHIIMDSFALFRSYNLSCSVPFSLIAGMRTEEKYIPWMFLRHTMPSATMFDDPDVYELISDYYISLAAGTYRKLGWNVSKKDKYQTRFTRIEILEFLCLQLKYEKCIEDFEIMSEKNQTLHDDVVLIFDRLGELLNQNETETENSNSTTSHKDGVDFAFEDMISECSVWIIENLPQNTLYNVTDGGDSFHSGLKVFPIIITVLTIFYCI